MADWDFTTLVQLADQNISQADVGNSAWVEASQSRYQAIRPGRGLACWEVIGGPAGQAVSSASGEFSALQRTFTFSDTDIDVAAVAAAMNLGAPLPAGAFVLAVYADVTQDWSDGEAGTFSAAVGIAGDDDYFTPTALDIDAGAAKLTQSVALSASGAQLIVTIAGSANLNTLTGGAMALTVLYVVPQTTVVEAPQA